MSKQLTSISIKNEQLAHLCTITEVNSTSSVVATIWIAHDRYLDTQWAEHHDEFTAWAAEASEQQQNLVEWLLREAQGGEQDSLEPETPAFKPIAPRSHVGCQLTTVAMSDDQHQRFEFLGAYYGKTLGALAEDAYAAYIQSEMLDDPEGFEKRRKSAKERTEGEVEKFLAINLRIS
jgi:hypothetical protein